VHDSPKILIFQKWFSRNNLPSRYDILFLPDLFLDFEEQNEMDLKVFPESDFKLHEVPFSV